jgi:ubiquinone/menaquinone biosynthesis C-methylase UbiE
MPEENARFEGFIPAFYDRYMVPMIFDPFSRDLAGRILGRPGTDLLELACGTGVVTQEVLKSLGPDARLTATDLNPGMLEVAKERVGQDPRLSWQTADATDLPFANDAFDTLFCQFGVMFFPDKPGAFRQARRVLRRGGRLVFNTWDRIEENPFAHIAHHTVASFFEDGPPEFYKIPFGFHDVDAVTAMLRARILGRSK